MRAKKPEVVIVGTGAMACLFAARLAQSGIRPMLLGTWVEGVQALRERGVRLVAADGNEQAFAVQATTHAQDCLGIEYSLVLVKSWQTERASRQLADCLSPVGLALTLQNGEGNYEILSQQLGTQRVALGATTAGATLLGPGIVRPAGQGEIHLGSHPKLQPLAALLIKAGFVVETVPDIRSLQWGKMVINAAINPLTALLRVSNGELLNREPARTVMAQAAGEAAAVAAAQGISLPYADPVLAAEMIARRTAANFSSMFQDVMRGAPTEIDAISGAIVRAGEKAGVLTPVNHTLWLLVRALAGSER